MSHTKPFDVIFVIVDAIHRGKVGYMWKNTRKYYSPWLDVITFSIMIGAFLYVVICFGSLPAEIPIHFNGAGEADGWGNKGSIIGLMVVNFHAVMLCIILNYFLIIRSEDTMDSLQFINIPFIKKEELTLDQIYLVKKNAARMIAVMNLMMSVLFGMIYYDIVQNGLDKESRLGSGIGIMIILILFPIIYYTWKTYQDIKHS